MSSQLQQIKNAQKCEQILIFCWIDSASKQTQSKSYCKMRWWILLGRILWEICSLPLSHIWIMAQRKEARIWPILHILNASGSILPITCYYAHLCSSVAFFRFGIMRREQTSEQLWHKDSRTWSPFRELSPASLLCAYLSSIIKASATSVIQWLWHRSQGGTDKVSGILSKG